MGSCQREFSGWHEAIDKRRKDEGGRVAVIDAKNHKRQRHKRQSVTTKREKSQTPKFLTAILTLPSLTSPNLT